MHQIGTEWTWGAIPASDGRWRFRLWAPDLDRLQLCLGNESVPMASIGEGWFETTCPAEAGTAYAFILPDGSAVPDPASRFQAEDVHGPSVLCRPPSSDPADGWKGRPWEEAIIYELHVGTFTPEGTFRAAIERLDHLCDTGVTCIELMPLAHFPGDRGWGYDGVLLYAPHPAYGTPDDLRALIRAAHQRGLMVLLDIVLNHFGSIGNYLPSYASTFLHSDRTTPWGEMINYGRPAVRAYFIENAVYWLSEFGFDGLRFDAIDHIHDESELELMVEVARVIRKAVPDRLIHLTTEDARNVTYLHERENGRVVLHTAEWNDDFHNVAHVIATGETEGYYGPYARNEWGYFARCLAEGFAFQGGTHHGESEKGHPSGHMPPAAFVDFLQNHDQVGNRAFGERLASLTSRDMMESLTAILLLSPHIPLIFMGDEYGETRPFCYFADYDGEMAEAVRTGRRREFAQFSAFIVDPQAMPDPISRDTFYASKLDWEELVTEDARARLKFIRQLIDLRFTHVVPRLAATGGHSGRVLKADLGAIAVDWQLDGACLQLRAALSPDATDLPEASGERLLRAGHADHLPFAEIWIVAASP